MDTNNTLKDTFMKNIKDLDMVNESSDNKVSKSSKVELYKLDSNTIKILTDRIKDEYIAHYYYRAAANWC